MITYDVRFQAFDGEFAKGATSCNMLLNFSAHEEALALALGDRIITWLDNHLSEVKSFAANQLLHLKNESWLKAEQDPISHSEFVSKIRMEAVTGYSKGHFQVFFFDNDLFFGHTLVVDVSSQLVMEYATLAG